ncbi:N-Acetylneuraminate cytidylyltransferase [Chitinispirillum alkaliphilum]|nr:N-Acetylneuraminate cytidylyltransferase [Chitinispirillum alkaliphilum]
MKIVAIIPARGGSKGVPGKNIRQFAGKPLVVHSIEQALSVSLIENVFVSTDDEEIAEISQNAGASIIKRPAELSGDSATSESAIGHAISQMISEGIDPDIIVFLQATSPLRPEDGIAQALKKFISFEYDSLLSLSPTHRFFWKLREDEAIAQYDYLNRPRRQDIKDDDRQYVENGSLYIFKKETFLKTGNRLGGRIGYTIFEEEYSYEIDTETDFTVLEKLAQEMWKSGRLTVIT